MEVLHHDINGKLRFRVAWAKDDGKPERFYVEVGPRQIELPAWLAESLTRGLLSCASTGAIQVFHGVAASDAGSGRQWDFPVACRQNITFHCDPKYQTTETHFDDIQGRLQYRVAWDVNGNAERLYIEIGPCQMELPPSLAESLLKGVLFGNPDTVGEIEFVHASEEASQRFQRRIKEWAAERRDKPRSRPNAQN